MNEDWENFKKNVTPIIKKKILGKVTKKTSFNKKNTSNKAQIIEHDLLNEAKNKPNYLDKNLIKKIKNGKIKIDGKLDLHGYSSSESKHLIVEFIEKNFSLQKRLLLIITGKGERILSDHGWENTGKLKNNVPKWLNSNYLSKYVLWYDNAPQNKGGEGALFVFLRKIRE